MGGARNPGIGPYGDMGQQRGPTANYGSQNQQKSRGSGRGNDYVFMQDRSLRCVVVKLLALLTEIVGSTPGFSGLLDETLHRGSVSI